MAICHCCHSSNKQTTTTTKKKKKKKTRLTIQFGDGIDTITSHKQSLHLSHGGCATTSWFFIIIFSPEHLLVLFSIFLSGTNFACKRYGVIMPPENYFFTASSFFIPRFLVVVQTVPVVLLLVPVRSCRYCM